MKVVVVGGGIISNSLVAQALEPIHIKRFSIRDLSGNIKAWAALINECINADVVVYMAYHHRDLPLNVRLLSKILRCLKNEKWRGRFVFFNTQSVLVTKILKGPAPLPKIFSYDLYTTTKKIQSYILKRYSGDIDICEIFLPVVIGKDTKAQNRFKFISEHEAINLPMRGLHVFAYLELNIFVTWFWGQFVNQEHRCTAHLNPRQIFVYQGTQTFADMIKRVRMESIQKKINIDDCTHKYRFSESMLSNLLWCLKLSPAWLLMSLMRNAFKKLVTTRKMPKFSDQKFCGVGKKGFTPIGPEYQYYGASIDMNAIPFPKVQIG